VSRAHLRHLNPLPGDLPTCCALRARARARDEPRPARHAAARQYLSTSRGYTKVQGKPFKASEILEKILA
jgi:hypothetical protein